MSEMIDRVAAIFAAELMELTAAGRREFSFPDSVNGDTIDRARSAARLAIAAMREPTEQMATNPMATCYNYGPYGDKEVRRIYRAMIDAALKPAPEMATP